MTNTYIYIDIKQKKEREREKKKRTVIHRFNCEECADDVIEKYIQL